MDSIRRCGGSNAEGGGRALNPLIQFHVIRLKIRTGWLQVGGGGGGEKGKSELSGAGEFNPDTSQSF